MITTHVIDLAAGHPARGLFVRLERETSGEWKPVGQAITDQNGRVAAFGLDGVTTPGRYRLTFDLARYHQQGGHRQSFFPEATITFHVDDANDHYHVPLLISPFGYSTYRGS
jgi:5-hydroxyisourate hydrolase